jgi:F-type H+-transporting ATPase subunit gamma
MKMVSAAKLRKAQNAIIHMRPYAQKLSEIVSHLSSSVHDLEYNPFSQQRKPERILLVTISSNRGLCGAFNSNVLKKVNTLITEKYSNQFAHGNVSIISIGKKANESLTKKGFKVIEEHNKIYENLNYENVAVIAQKIMHLFEEKFFDRIELIYNSFKNVATQDLKNEQYLPVEFDTEEKIHSNYIFEPDKVLILEKLIPKTLTLQLYKAILDSNTSEHGARMTAMHKATDNASEMIKGLTLTYNKARQAAITKEILEIVGGAEALKG